MPATSLEPFVAARCELAAGFVCFTTSRQFDETQSTPHEDAGLRLIEILRQDFRCRPSRLVFAGQVHGNTVAVCGREGEPIERIAKCDALVTAGRSVFLVIRTADCVPVVLTDETAGICAGLHAGWRGTRQNIISRTVRAMEQLGAVPARIRGWIGPAISSRNYPVAESLAGEFTNAFGRLGEFANGTHLDLPELNILQAVESGLRPDAILRSGYCTFEHESLFHSHRRQGRSRGHLYTVCGFDNDA